MGDLRSHSIGPGWKLADNQILCEELLLVTYDSQSHSDSLLCVQAGKNIPIQRKIIHYLAMGSGRNLYYAADSGIYSFNLDTNVEILLTSIVLNEHLIHGMWVSPTNTVFYLLSDISLPNPEPRACSVTIQASSLLRLLPKRGAPPEEIIRFNELPSFVAFSWHQNTAFATLGKMSKFRISRIDLDSGKESTLEEFSVNAGLAISPRDALVIWPLLPRRIEERRENGDRVILAETGSCPSFSPAYGHMAFMGDAHDVWLKYDNEQPQRIFAPPSSGAANEVEVPTWCSCGKHFAVSVEVPSTMKTSGRATLCADIEKKELYFLEDSAPYYRRAFTKVK